MCPDVQTVTQPIQWKSSVTTAMACWTWPALTPDYFKYFIYFLSSSFISHLTPVLPDSITSTLFLSLIIFVSCKLNNYSSECNPNGSHLSHFHSPSLTVWLQQPLVAIVHTLKTYQSASSIHVCFFNNFVTHVLLWKETGTERDSPRPGEAWIHSQCVI